MSDAAFTPLASATARSDCLSHFGVEIGQLGERRIDRLEVLAHALTA